MEIKYLFWKHHICKYTTKQL